MQVQSRSAACVSYRGYGGDIIGRSYMFIYLPYTHSAHTTRLESRVEALLDATCGPPDPRAPEATPGWTFSSEFTSTDLEDSLSQCVVYLPTLHAAEPHPGER